jgi:hypothetical protein
MPLTMLSRRARAASQVALDLDALERLRRANRRLRSVAFWRKRDNDAQRRAPLSDNVSGFATMRLGPMSLPLSLDGQRFGVSRR